jgi:protease-4
MVRRGLALLLTVLGVAGLVSLAGLVSVYWMLGREPSVPRGATLTIRLGGALAETAPSDVFGYLQGSRVPTISGVVDSLRKAKVDSRVKAVLLKPTGFTTPYWAKVQEIRDAIIDFKRSG